MPSRVDEATVGEQQPLLGGPPKPTRNGLASLRRRLTADVSRDWADLVLLFCYMITGLLDSASISSWGSFVSMQTGNTVYIGLGIAAPRESTRWIKSLTSLASFCLGAFAFSRFHRYFSPRRRWVLVASFTFQFALCVAAASILTFAPASKSTGGSDLSWNVLVPIALIAFQSCGQAVTSRALKYNALTSVVLTSIYTDLFGDADLFKGRNAERNRRVVAPLMLVVGAIGGGLFAHSNVGIAGALWLASILKLFMVAAWAFWPADAEEA
ncbi:hypothetical protein F5X68DRAFT_201829 [Plectosphaerella plurivora]|uniref:DUF1275 domain protein n=1 Tax=Plectosphaerella plurivora TaxID=936078 RepID=A0A9P9AAP6_9PEZI|nr:hypothetical protein F5X68DRAFT_201829 [Plectosphaerella plurivora]